VTEAQAGWRGFGEFFLHHPHFTPLKKEINIYDCLYWKRIKSSGECFSNM
jgi:hypothetical protein